MTASCAVRSPGTRLLEAHTSVSNSVFSFVFQAHETASCILPLRYSTGKDSSPTALPSPAPIPAGVSGCLLSLLSKGSAVRSAASAGNLGHPLPPVRPTRHPSSRRPRLPTSYQPYSPQRVQSHRLPLRPLVSVPAPARSTPTLAPRISQERVPSCSLPFRGSTALEASTEPRPQPSGCLAWLRPALHPAPSYSLFGAFFRCHAIKRSLPARPNQGVLTLPLVAPCPFVRSAFLVVFVGLSVSTTLSRLSVSAWPRRPTAWP